MSSNQSYQAGSHQGQQQSYGHGHPVGYYNGLPNSQNFQSYQQGSQQTPQSGPPQVPYALPNGEPPLPQGWIKEWSAQHNAWFYVNTLAQPSTSQWTHPGPSLPSQYLPPSGPPPPAGYAGSTSTLNISPPTYAAAPAAALNGAPSTTGDHKLGNREGKVPNECVSQGHVPPPAGPLPSGPSPPNTHSSPPSVHPGPLPTHPYAPPFCGAQATNSHAAPAAIYGPPPVPNHAPAGGYAPVTQKGPAAASVPAVAKPKSGFLGAGLGALGGLALGAFASHEWSEHERREEQKEENAYEAGILAASRY